MATGNGGIDSGELGRDEEDQLSRSTKKAKTNEIVEDIMDESMEDKEGNGETVRVEQTEQRKQNPSFKDLLLGVNGKEAIDRLDEELDTWDRDMFSDDEEEDMSEEEKRKAKDLLGPEVDIPKERRPILCAPWKNAIIVKLLGKDVQFKFLFNRLQKVWTLTGTFTMTDVPNKYYMIRFSSEKDLDFALQGGPWMVAGHYLMCQRWKPEFKPFNEDVRKQAVWVRIPELPVEYYEKHTLWEVGNIIGRTLKVDGLKRRGYSRRNEDNLLGYVLKLGSRCLFPMSVTRLCKVTTKT